MGLVLSFARVTCAVILVAGLVACSDDAEPGSTGPGEEIPANCGDGVCDDGESLANCASDCTDDPVSECGDGVCGPDETLETCAADCSDDPVEPCGDGVCDAAAGETPDNCADDCTDEPPAPCGDGVCNEANGEDETTCPEDCGGEPPDTCGDGVCDPADGETPENCAADCSDDPPEACGDGVCDEAAGETPENCAADCEVEDLCGNGTCDEGEDVDNCAADCLVEPCTFPAEFGCECEENDDCQSGYCVPTGDGFQCSKACDADCPAGWSCKLLSSGGDATYICLPLFSNLCRPCETGADCKGLGEVGGDCIPFADGQGSFCGGDCDSDTDCPEDYSCGVVDLGDGTQTTQCQPDNGICLCNQNAIDDAAQTSCSTTNDAGTCQGIRKCVPGGLTACDAPQAVFETCDGEDNDCDGEADEPEEVDLSCEITNDFGTCTGTQKCVEGANQECDADTPTEEICDGVDNNCDGIADEGFPDTDADNIADCEDPDDDGDGLPDTNDNCPDVANDDQADFDGDGKGDACDDDIDDDGTLNEDDCDDANVEIQCTTYYWDGDGDGFCQCDVSKCLCAEQGNYTVVECVPQVSEDCQDDNEFIKPGAAEECDGFDNDCNGLTDDGEPDFDQDGLRDDCDDDIDGDGTLNDADCDSADPTIPGDTEFCNGVDDDCDGQVDEDWAEVAVIDGVAAVTACDGDDDDQCNNGVFFCNESNTDIVCEETTDSVVEICDGADNDCDGDVDEDWADSLGQACDSDDTDFCANGVVVCALDGSTTECGTETEVDIAEICDGLDNNCDTFTDEDWPEIGEACDGDDTDFCLNGAFQCSEDGQSTVCGSEGPGQEEICGNELDDNCDEVVNEGCQPASVEFTFSGFFVPESETPALGEGYSIELTGAEVGVTGSSPGGADAYSVDFGFHAVTSGQ
ncbi:MAG: MopE-related protein [Myxococcota bacterium]|nr:MopE-related protein [Myxococcota bacterium]